MFPELFLLGFYYSYFNVFEAKYPKRVCHYTVQAKVLFGSKSFINSGNNRHHFWWTARKYGIGSYQASSRLLFPTGLIGILYGELPKKFDDLSTRGCSPIANLSLKLLLKTTLRRRWRHDNSSTFWIKNPSFLKIAYIEKICIFVPIIS